MTQDQPRALTLEELKNWQPPAQYVDPNLKGLFDFTPAQLAAAKAKQDADAKLYAQKLPTSSQDEFTTPTMPTPEQAKVLGVTVTSTPVETHPPSYPQGNVTPAPTMPNMSIPGAPAWVNDAIKIGQIAGGIAVAAIQNLPTDFQHAMNVKAWPEKYQPELKQRYEAEHKPENAMAVGANFGYSVTLDRDGLYRERPMIIFGEMGMATEMIGAVELGMSSAQYTRFLNARANNPTLTPEMFRAAGEFASLTRPFTIESTAKQELTEILNAANRTNVSELAKKQALEAWRIKNNTPPETLSKITEYVDKYKEFPPSDYWQLHGEINPFEPTAIPSYLRTITAESTSIRSVMADTGKDIAPALESVSKIVASSATPETIVSTLISQGAISAALAVAPQATLTILNSITQAQRDIALSTIPSEIANAVTSNQSAVTIQSIAQAEVNQQAQLSAGIQAMVNTAAKVIADNKVQPETKPLISPLFESEVKAQPNIQAQIKTELNRQIQTVTDPAIKTQLQAQVQTITDTATKTQNQVKTPTEKGIDRVTRSKVEITTPKEDMPFKTPYKGGNNDLHIEHEGKRIDLTHEDAWVAWKQGIMYYLKWKPYDKPHTICTRKPIAGVKYFEGPGSAAKSIVSL